MVVLCLGPVCVPLHLLFPFLLALAHQRGYFLWIKREWVTFRYWSNKIFSKRKAKDDPTEAEPLTHCHTAEKQSLEGDAKGASPAPAAEASNSIGSRTRARKKST